MPATREEWLAMRKNYIGASEIAALLGFQADFQLSPLALYLVKRGEIEAPEIGGERIEWGNDFEDAICKAACRREGWELQPAMFAVDDSTPGMSASLDRVIRPSEKDIAAGFVGPGTLEAMNVDFLQFREKWLDDEPPPHILIQLQDQLACSGFLWGAVTACVGGNEYYVRRYLRHEGIIAEIRAAGTRFWDAVRAGELPEADGYEATTKALRAKYPSLQQRTIDLSGDNELPGLCVRQKELAAQRKAIETEEERIKNTLRKKMGDAQLALIAGGIKVSHSIGEDTPPRPARPGEVINGRKGQDRITITLPKAA